MKRNIGKIGVWVRIILVVVSIGLGVYFKSWWGLAGLVLLVVAAIGWCPLCGFFKKGGSCAMPGPGEKEKDQGKPCCKH